MTQRLVVCVRRLHIRWSVTLRTFRTQLVANCVYCIVRDLLDSEWLIGAVLTIGVVVKSWVRSTNDFATTTMSNNWCYVPIWWYNMRTYRSETRNHDNGLNCIQRRNCSLNMQHVIFLIMMRTVIVVASSFVLRTHDSTATLTKYWMSNPFYIDIFMMLVWFQLTLVNLWWLGSKSHSVFFSLGESDTEKPHSRGCDFCAWRKLESWRETQLVSVVSCASHSRCSWDADTTLTRCVTLHSSRTVKHRKNSSRVSFYSNTTATSLL